jgi:hypothetical protein
MSESPTPNNSQNQEPNKYNLNGHADFEPNDGAPNDEAPEGDGRAPNHERLNVEPGSRPSYPPGVRNRSADPDPPALDRGTLSSYEEALRGVDLKQLRAIIRHQEERGAPNPEKLLAAYRVQASRLNNQNARLNDKTRELLARLQEYGDDPSDLMGTAERGQAVEPTESNGPLTDEHPLDGCDPFPEKVFSDLPAVLHETCGFWSRKHKRDVFLTSSLGLLSGCLPNLHGYWGADVPAAVRPNLFTTFVAGASGGKSAGNFARKLVRGVADRVKEQSRNAVKKWKDERAAAETAGEPFDVPRPPDRSFYVPADVSATHLLDTLSKQDGRGVIYSSEIDTLADALGQDWGGFDSFLRKAYHHEADAKGRRSDGTISVVNPSVSLVLGGTAKGFTNLIQSPENGLYSRLCLYYFEAYDPWEDQTPTKEGDRRLERFDALSGRVADLWSTLKGRPDPLQFQITDTHWTQIREALQPMHRRVQEGGFTHLISVPRRAGLWAFRIAMVLTALRAHDNGAPLRRLDTVEATDTDVNAALRIAETYADHAIRFARAKLGDTEPATPRDRRIAAMLSAVGMQFSSGEAYDAARAAGFSQKEVSRSTLYRDLKAAAKRGLIRKGGGRSRWHKE